MSVASPKGENAEFWAAARDGVLLLPRCRDCAEFFWYPREFCPLCGGVDVELVPAAGTGHVHSRTIVRQAGGEFGEAVPYVLAYVELDEGIRLLTNVVDCDPESVGIGDAVALAVSFTAGGSALFQFAPDPALGTAP